MIGRIVLEARRWYAHKPTYRQILGLVTLYGGREEGVEGGREGGKVTMLSQQQ
jgi:hypothetical protein